MRKYDASIPEKKRERYIADRERIRSLQKQYYRNNQPIIKAARELGVSIPVMREMLA